MKSKLSTICILILFTGIGIYWSFNPRNNLDVVDSQDRAVIANSGNPEEIAKSLWRLHQRKTEDFDSLFSVCDRHSQPPIKTMCLRIAAARRLPAYEEQLRQVLFGTDAQLRLSIILGYAEQSDQAGRQLFLQLWKRQDLTKDEKSALAFGILQATSDPDERQLWQTEFIAHLGQKFTTTNRELWHKALTIFPDDEKLRLQMHDALLSAGEGDQVGGVSDLVERAKALMAPKDLSL